MTAEQQLTQQLKKTGAFWSYSSESLSDLSDKLLIEECLRWGDVPEIIQLFSLFSVQTIQNVWEQQLIPDERIYPHNYYLAKIFFDIEKPDNYIKPLQKKYSRYERIKQFNA